MEDKQNFELPKRTVVNQTFPKIVYTKTLVLFLWGNKDSALRRSGVEWTQDYVSNYYRFVELDAGHWLIQESYEEVQKEILLHLEKF